MIAALAIGAATDSGGSGSGARTPTVLPPLTVTAPPHADSEAAACAKVIEHLPVRLGRLDPRVVHTKPDTPYVVAWGDPAIVLACGAGRPKDLVPGSPAEFFTNGPDTGPFYDVTKSGSANVWTTVDRTAYIAITVPSDYQGSTVLPPLSRAIAQALPAVCSTDPSAPVARLCTRRS